VDKKKKKKKKKKKRFFCSFGLTLVWSSGLTLVVVGPKGYMLQVEVVKTDLCLRPVYVCMLVWVAYIDGEEIGQCKQTPRRQRPI